MTLVMLLLISELDSDNAEPSDDFGGEGSCPLNRVERRIESRGEAVVGCSQTSKQRNGDVVV
jgi:hypothetical protein